MKRIFILILALLLLTACSDGVIQSPDIISTSSPSGNSGNSGSVSTRPSEAPPEVTEIVDD